MRRTMIVVGAIAAALLTATAMKPYLLPGWQERDESRQLKFSHKKHVKEGGITCDNCHAAGKSTNAADNLRASHDNCNACHEEQVSNTCNYCHVDPENIKAFPAPTRSIVFAHKIHLEMPSVECATCHKGLEDVEYAGPANMPTMSTCNGCHNGARAANACEACHTSFTNLVPADHLVADFKKDHKNLTRVGALETQCSTCHTQTFCTECHAPAGLVGFGKAGLMADPTPRNAPGDSPRAMSLQMAHSMNYRFTHGIEAKSKAADCYTCHSAQAFCSECHDAGSGVEGAFKPAWHLGAGFSTIGVGTGGGLHATLAKRDIESCVTCHDAQGNDPICVTCHVDPDGVRGTDPRTHPAGYMKGEEGPWHSNTGATCYNCHTDLNAHPRGTRGKGFCGYCHGS
jgi:hypothetical protein